MDNLPKGQSGESSRGDKNYPGVYRHEGAKKELITSPGDEGFVQGDALVRVGYVRVGDVPSREEVLKMQEAQAEKDAASEKEDDKDSKKSDK